MRLKHQEQSSPSGRFVPKSAPQDVVSEAGIAWLDGLSGDPFQSQQLTAEFSPEVWNSPARKPDDLP